MKRGYNKRALRWTCLGLLCGGLLLTGIGAGIQLVEAGLKRTAVSFPLNFAVVYVMGPICNGIIILYELAGLIECMVKGPRDYRDKGGDEE